MTDNNTNAAFARDGPPEPVPISALAHFSYCPRRCALIHVEQTFDENIYTLKGDLLHVMGESGSRAALPFIESVAAGDDDEEVRAAAREAMDQLA